MPTAVTSIAETMGETDVNIYEDNLESDETYDTSNIVEDIVDNHFGGYKNEIFYDYTKLFFIIIVFVFFIKLFSLLFGNKR